MGRASGRLQGVADLPIRLIARLVVRRLSRVVLVVIALLFGLLLLLIGGACLLLLLWLSQFRPLVRIVSALGGPTVSVGSTIATASAPIIVLVVILPFL